MVKSEFAPQHPRNQQGWILFPLDKGKGPRQDLFPPEAMEHPAKYNFAMIESIIEYVSEPDETITVTSEILVEMDREVDWCSH